MTDRHPFGHVDSTTWHSYCTACKPEDAVPASRLDIGAGHISNNCHTCGAALLDPDALEAARAEAARIDAAVAAIENCCGQLCCNHQL